MLLDDPEIAREGGKFRSVLLSLPCLASRATVVLSYAAFLSTHAGSPRGVTRPEGVTCLRPDM